MTALQGRWMAGMLLNNGARVIAVNKDDDVLQVFGGGCAGWFPFAWANGFAGGLDKYDAGSRGCLLARVREAWGREDIWVRRLRDPGLQKWEVCMGSRGLALDTTEADALVAALEAAPGPVTP